MGKRIFVIVVMVLSVLAMGKTIEAEESEVLIIDEDNKRVGINRSPRYVFDVEAPWSMLHVESTTGTSPANFLFKNSSGYMAFGIEGAIGCQILGDYNDRSPYARIINTMSAYPLKLAVNSKTAMTILDGGNVGIGTTEPVNLLHLKSNYARIKFESTNDGTENWAIGSDSSPAGFFISNVTDNAARMFIHNNGNVGIGTTSPVYNLDVIGNIHSTNGFLTANNRQIGWRNSGNTANNDWILNSSDVMQYRSGGTPLVSITESGNVGIGTTSSSYKLTVDGDVSLISSANFIATNKIQSLTTTTGFPLNIKALGTTNDIVFYTNELARMGISAKGNVGIGTTSPSSLLHIDKNQNAETTLHISNNNTGLSSSALIRLVAENTGQFAMSSGKAGIYSSIQASILSQSQNGLLLNVYDANPFMVRTNNVERFRIDSSGNVGIGTTSPTEKLEVTGDTKTEAVILGKDEFPASPIEGMLFFNKNDKHFYGYNGTSWVRLDSTWVKLD